MLVKFPFFLAVPYVNPEPISSYFGLVLYGFVECNFLRMETMVNKHLAPPFGNIFGGHIFRPLAFSGRKFKFCWWDLQIGSFPTSKGT